MRCPSCDTENQSRRRRCTACGGRLEFVCQGCRRRSPLSARFCASSGLRLAAQPAPEAAKPPDRRQLTVLFSDIVDSVALANRLDTEDFRAVIAACPPAEGREGDLQVAQALLQSPPAYAAALGAGR